MGLAVTVSHRMLRRVTHNGSAKCVHPIAAADPRCVGASGFEYCFALFHPSFPAANAVIVKRVHHLGQWHAVGVLVVAKNQPVLGNGKALAHEGHDCEMVSRRPHELVERLAKQVGAGVGNTKQVIGLESVPDEPLRTGHIALGRILLVAVLRQEMAPSHTQVIIGGFFEQSEYARRGVGHHVAPYRVARIGQSPVAGVQQDARDFEGACSEHHHAGHNLSSNPSGGDILDAGGLVTCRVSEHAGDPTVMEQFRLGLQRLLKMQGERIG